MAFLHGRNTVVLVNEWNLSPYLNSASINPTGETADTTTFGATWKTAIAGHLSMTASFAGFHDVDQTELDDVLGTEGQVLTVCPGAGAAIGDHAWLLPVVETSLARSSPLGGAVAIAWDALASSAAALGEVLHPVGEDTNTTTGASRDGAAATTTGWMAHLHVTGPVDGGAWVVKLQDSADNSSWADVTGGAFASLSAVGSERLVSSASDAELRRYVRYVATRTGGSAGQGITFALAYARRGA